jgi:acyl-CoA synthetase (NDP forming)
LYDDFFRRLGIVRAADFAQFSDALRILSRYKEMSGRRIGVVSTSGGANSLVADEVERLGLELPAFTERTVRRLGELIDDFGAAHNPVDVTVQLTVHPETFGPVVQTIVDDPNVDALLVVLTTNSDPPAAVMADALVAQMRVLEKPVVIVRMGPESIAPKALSVYRANGVPVFTTPEQGVRCLASLAAYAEARRRGVQG